MIGTGRVMHRISRTTHTRDASHLGDASHLPQDATQHARIQLPWRSYGILTFTPIRNSARLKFHMHVKAEILYECQGNRMRACCVPRSLTSRVMQHLIQLINMIMSISRCTKNVCQVFLFGKKICQIFVRSILFFVVVRHIVTHLLTRLFYFTLQICGTRLFRASKS